ncbi:MAG: hypothetical protein MI974_03270 [Chitinophagales bacterium]|nr:hypothetical protein [Chitinophagales bacterium]
MYNGLLVSHSMFRWFVLLSLVTAIIVGIRGWVTKKEFNKFDNNIRHWTATIAHIQLMFGIALYSISPIIRYFFENFKDAVKLREIRFFGMEHSVMMLLAISAITFGSYSAKRKVNDTAKFKTMTIWFLIGLIIILANIPWGFSIFVSRPYLRLF